jgi:hypothetical protein
MGHVDIRQVSPHHSEFFIGRCQQNFVDYRFSFAVGALACLDDSKVFPAHFNPDSTGVPGIPRVKFCGLRDSITI